MSALSIHGKLLFSEEPKHKEGSMLMVVAVGPEKKETAAMIQGVNKIIVRIPPRSKLQKVAESLEPNDYVEIFGHVKGTVQRDIGTGSTSLNIEIVAVHIEPCEISSVVPVKRVDSMLFARWMTTGKIRALKPPTKEGKPGTMYLHVDADRKNANRAFQHSGVVPVTVFPPLWDKIKDLPAQHPMLVTTRVTGVLRRLPRVDEPGEFDTRLQSGLILDQYRTCGLFAKSLNAPKKPGKPSGKDAEVQKEEKADASDA